MNILGLADFSGSHDMSAALVRNGHLVAAAEEERFTRNKHQGGLAINAIDYCLAAAQLKMQDIDAIAFADLPYRFGPSSPHADTDMSTLQRLREEGLVRYRSLIHKRLVDAFGALQASTCLSAGIGNTAATALAQLQEKYGHLPRIFFYDHHRSHAAAAFLTSPFEESAVVTVDVRGGSHATVMWRGRGCTLERTAAEPFTNSLGHFYSACTEYIGLSEYGEGKMMGLAAYGERERFRSVVARMIDTSNSQPYRFTGPPTRELIGFPPVDSSSGVTDSPIPDFAAAVQDALERALLRISRSAMAGAGSRNLCLGGGVALNCSANGALLASDVADDYWLFPACGDAGLSIGSALLCAAEAGELQRGATPHAYWGPEFDNMACESVLRATPSVRYHQPRDVAADTAALLAEGNVVGWFQGRMEMGPRALGNRSILADPRTIEVRDRVNRIKRREAWRPLAPAVLSERAGEYFTPLPPSPFMLFAVQVRPEKRALVAGIVHVDGSARPQPVTREQNPRFHALLSAFAEATGVPVLLNTSFNLAGEPIVCTPADAIKTFLASDLDALVLGDFLVTRSG